MAATKTNAQLRHRLTAGLIGLAATGLVLVAYLLGWLAAGERVTLDVRLRYFCRPPVAEEKILVVGIDDPALARWGEWPWNRSRTAGLIGLLHELGAQAIAIDLLFDRPKAPRVNLPELDVDHDLEPRLARDQTLVVEPAVGVAFDDEELAKVIRSSGNVILAMDFPLHRESQPGEGHPRPANPSLPAPQADDYWPAFRSSARQQAVKALQKKPDLSFAEFVAGCPSLASASSPGTQPTPVLQSDSFARKELALAFRRAKSMQEMQRCLIRPAGRVPDWLPAAQTDQINPPLPTLVQSAKGVGFVGYASDFSDGIFRDVPLVVRAEENRLYPTLSLAVAARLFDWYEGGVSFAENACGRQIRIQPRSPASSPEGREITIPVHPHGNLLVAWPQASQWSQALPTVSVGPFMALLRDRELMVQNVRVHRLATAGVLGAFSGPVERYERVIRTLDTLERFGTAPEALVAGLDGFPRENPAPMQRDWLLQEATKLEKQADKIGRGQENDLAEGLKLPDLTSTERKKYQEQLDTIRALQQAQMLAGENRKLAEQIAAAKRELEPKVSKRVVFLGSVATGAVASDMIASPAYPAQTPGVIVHASVYNQLITGFFLHWPIGWLDALVILTAGVLATWLAVAMGPLAAGLAALGLVLTAGASAVGALAWGQWVLNFSGPLAAVGLSYLTVTTWKLRTEGRQRRLYADYFSQYTDPVLAKQIAEDFSLIERVEEREITVFFSDLAGFTPISERLGGQKTQQLLNLYFEHMGQVLRAKGAMINKYLGDGMMVFYNPVVNPQPDHALRAMESILACLEAVKKLNVQQRTLDPDWPELNMRVGVNTGPAIVGNLGSKDKTDYTCISDIVNLAARLEPANKVFGTEILMGGRTAEIVGSEFLCRPLGKLRAVGKEGLVEIFEPLGCTANMDESMHRQVKLWQEALQLFYARKWDEAVYKYLEIRDLYPKDSAAGIYLGLCMSYQNDPPPDTWQGEYVQTSK